MSSCRHQCFLRWIPWMDIFVAIQFLEWYSSVRWPYFHVFHIQTRTKIEWKCLRSIFFVARILPWSTKIVEICFELQFVQFLLRVFADRVTSSGCFDCYLTNEWNAFFICWELCTLWLATDISVRTFRILTQIFGVCIDYNVAAVGCVPKLQMNGAIELIHNEFSVFWIATVLNAVCELEEGEIRWQIGLFSLGEFETSWLPGFIYERVRNKHGGNIKFMKRIKIAFKWNFEPNSICLVHDLERPLSMKVF